MVTLVKDIPGLQEGIERLATFFDGRATRQGLLARRALGTLTAADEAVRDRLVHELRAETRLDGSVGGATVPTIWRVIELLELGHRADESGVIRVVGWVLGLQDQPGAFGQGCSDQRHTHRVCEHFVGGFFAPALPTERVSPVSLPSGKVFRSESAARFAISCLALRAALMANQESRPLIQRHLDSLVLLQKTWSEWEGYFPPDAMIAALGPLAVAPPPYRQTLPEAAAFIARHQAKDGSWPHADLYHALDNLIAAGTAKAKFAVCRAVPCLLSRQRPDGSFGSTAQEERALIALRALLWARTRG